MPERVPDFLIIGAMKSGTSAVHELLEDHPDVFVARGEVSFFSLDDREQHPEFFVSPDLTPIDRDFDGDFDVYFDWYKQFFFAAQSSQLLGEDSTGYLPSANAPERIARVLPNSKLIAILRDPVERAYSHYWHLVISGRATHDFATSLRLDPENILQRGHYREQLARYLDHFSRSQMSIVFFEDLAADSAVVVKGLYEFLGLEPHEPTQLGRVNPGYPPKLVPLQLWLNGRDRMRIARRLAGHLPDPSGQPVSPYSLWRRLRPIPVMRALNQKVSGPYPAMGSSERQFLTAYYRRELAGLDELLMTDLSTRWPWWGADPDAS